MKFTLFALASLAATASAFSPLSGNGARTKPAAKSSVADSIDSNNRPIRDPFGLYPSDAPERKEGRILPIETIPEKPSTVIDPLNLYADKSSVTASPDMSASLPFLERPAILDGSMAGDRGFDPFNFSNDANSLQWYRDAEVKHARLAMLAAVGWPLAELMNKSIDRVPSVLNGGLDKVSPVFWAGLLTVLSAVELLGIFNPQKNNGSLVAEGFDPLGRFGKTEEQRKFSQEAELFNGRLAMLAIVGFAIQEFITQTPVIEQTPLFFKPFF